MVPNWQKGIVRKVEAVNPGTRRFFIELPEVKSFDFIPGQFVTLDLPIHEQRNKRWRSYSIASAPNGTNMIELIIVLLEGGVGSQYIFNEIKEGSELTLRGPQGIFILPTELKNELFLICTGAGVAPFRSMLQYLATHTQPHGAIHLIFGTRTQSEILYREEFEALTRTIADFHYYPTLSREDWAGRKGYVHKIYEELCAGKPSATFMLCGWKPMVDEAKHRILEMGYSKKQVLLELYG